MEIISFLFIYFLKDSVYLLLERKGRRKRGRKVSVCGCLSFAPYWGPAPQPRHVPGLGIEQATLWFAARAQSTELHQPGPFYLFLQIKSNTICACFRCRFQVRFEF